MSLVERVRASVVSVIAGRGMRSSMYARTRVMLEKHRPALHAFAGAPLERQTLDGPEALDLLAAIGVECARPNTAQAAAFSARA